VERAEVLATAIDEAPVCVFVADDEMRYVAVNAYACDVLGYAEEELLAMRVADVATYHEAPREYAAMMEHAYLRGRSRLRCRDGEHVWLTYVAGEVELDGRRLYVSIGRVEVDT
jgi:PAS domain S-box-containing protein